MSKVEQKQASKRAEIIEGLIPLISSVPFEQLSVADMCAATGISVGSFYHYFSAKSDILVGLLGLIDIEMEERAFPQLTSERETENLLCFARCWAEYVQRHGIERSILISGVMPENNDLSGKPRPTLIRLTERIARGQKSGELRADKTAQTLAELYLLALRGVTTDWSRNRGRYPIVKKMEEFMELFLRGLRA